MTLNDLEWLEWPFYVKFSLLFTIMIRVDSVPSCKLGSARTRPCTSRDMTTYWSKIAKKPTPPSFGTFLLGDLLRIFRRLIPCQKLESWGYQTVYISRSCFRFARHNNGVCQTDRQTDTSLSQRPRYSIASRG